MVNNEMIFQIIISLSITGLAWFVWHKYHFMKVIQELKQYIDDKLEKVVKDIAKEQTIRDVVAKEETTAKQSTLEKVNDKIINCAKEESLQQVKNKVVDVSYNINYINKTLDVFRDNKERSVVELQQTFNPFLNSYCNVVERNDILRNYNHELEDLIKVKDNNIEMMENKIEELNNTIVKKDKIIEDLKKQINQDNDINDKPTMKM